VRQKSLQRVASGRQAERLGAQKPQCTNQYMRISSAASASADVKIGLERHERASGGDRQRAGSGVYKKAYMRNPSTAGSSHRLRVRQKSLQRVASGRQAERLGAQKPQCTNQYMRISSTEAHRLAAAQQR